MFNLPITTHNSVNVMSSIDLAKMCVGTSKDAHSDFMKKANKVLGISVGNFSESHITSRGRTISILLLPEREACLMAMSYSYELQAKVYDAWQALRKPVQQIINPMDMIAVFAQQHLEQNRINIEVANKLAEVEGELESKFEKLPTTTKAVAQGFVNFYVIQSEAAKRYGISNMMVLNYITNTYNITKNVVKTGFTEFTTFNRKEFIEALDTFMAGAIQVSPKRVMHPDIPTKFMGNLEVTK